MTIWQTAAVYPLMVIVLLFITFISVYVIAVGKGDVDPILPYISDCAALYPQSAVFALLLDITGFLIVCTAFLRYRRVQIVLDATTTAAAAAAAAANASCAAPHRRIRVAYHVQFICGMFSLLGLLMVCNFQEFRTGHIHYLAVVIMAVGGGLYTAIDAIITSVLCRTESYSTWSIVIWRSTLVALTWVIAIISIMGREVSASKWEKQFPNETEMERFYAQLHWNATQPAFEMHLVSTSFEWLTALMVLLYFASFAAEFVDFSATVQIDNLTQPTINPSAQPAAVAATTSFSSSPSSSSKHPSPAENIHKVDVTGTAATSAAATAADDTVIGVPT